MPIPFKVKEINVVQDPSPSQIHVAANAAAAKLQPVGAESAVGEIYLCHFSEDPNITRFTNMGSCNWLDGFSISGIKTKRLTHILNITVVNSLYVIRVSMSKKDVLDCESEFSAIHSKGGAREFALTFDVENTHFSRIPIQYNSNTEDFTLKR
jgi:hypothetical protein